MRAVAYVFALSVLLLFSIVGLTLWSEGNLQPWLTLLFERPVPAESLTATAVPADVPPSASVTGLHSGTASQENIDKSLSPFGTAVGREEVGNSAAGKRIAVIRAELWSHYLSPHRGNWAAIRSFLAWVNQTQAQNVFFRFRKCKELPECYSSPETLADVV
eukprot:RCo011726